MVLSLIFFIIDIFVMIISTIFNISFDGIPLWSILLVLFIMMSVISILLSPVLSGKIAPVYYREKRTLVDDLNMTPKKSKVWRR